MNTKKYPFYLGNLLFWIVNVLTLTTYYPATIQNIEAQNPLLGAGDFIAETLQHPGGLIFILNTWLQQFFASTWSGAIIIATITSICTLCFKHILSTQECKGSAIWGMILASVALFVSFPNLLALLHLCCALLLFSLIVSWYHSKLNNWGDLVIVLFYPILGTTATVNLGLALLLNALIVFRKSKRWIPSAVSLILIIVFMLFWNRYISYLTSVEKQLFSMDMPTWILVALPLIGLLIHKVHNKFSKCQRPIIEWGTYTATALLFPILNLAQTDIIKLQEDQYQLEQAAESGNWPLVYQLANANRPNYTDLQLHYALLAENEMGTLADNLFYYPVSSTTDLYFWRRTEKDASFFNALFYKGLGVGDEYMHQIFEMGTPIHATTSARTIRHLTDAAIMQKDKALAQKYFDIAKSSQRNKAWTLQAEQKLKQLMEEQITDSIPDRTPFFIGTYEPKIEFVYMSMNDSCNIKRTNLMLCSFLLEKDMRRFKQALGIHQNIFKQKLPQAYAEAYLMANTDDKNYVLPLNLPDEKNQAWMNFLSLLNQEQISEINRQYIHSYWYYYLFTNVKALE